MSPMVVTRPESPSLTTASFNDDKIEWETLSRRGSDPSQCKSKCFDKINGMVTDPMNTGGYFSFPDFDRLTSMSGCSSHDDESSSA